MYRFASIKRISHILLAVSIFVTALFLPRPVSAQDLIPNPVAEAYVLNELRATGFADLSNFLQEERVIGGEFLLSVLKDSEVQGQPLIYIANAIVAGGLWANDLVISSNLFFTNMEFDGPVNFGGTQLQSITIYTSKFNDSLSFPRATLNGNVDLRDNVINESLNFYNAHILGELLLDGTQILGTEAMPGTSFPIEIWNTTVDGLASFNNVVFKGDAYFFGSSFDRLNMNGVTFNSYVSFNEATVAQIADFGGVQFLGDADFNNFHTDRDANFNDATFYGRANFENATTARDANFINVTFNGDAIFDYFTAKRFADFTNATFNQSFRYYYTLTAYPYFENTVFNGPVTFEGMQVSQDFELVNASYNYAEEPFPVTLADVGGAVSFTGLTAPAGLLLSGSHFGSLSISTNDNPEIAFIDFIGTDIDGDLLIENVNMKSFLAEGMSVGESTSLYHVTIADQLDMRNADIGFLKVDEHFAPPTNSQSFNLRGMKYTDIDLGDQGLTDDTWRGLLKFVNDSAYSPQAYQNLSQFLTDKGHPDWASEVELAQKRRERDEILTPLSGAWLWSWFLDIFSGYGHRPAQAFIWSGLVVAMGALVFRRKENMLPVQQNDAQVEYNPIWYSFALFLPYIDLGIASKWEPNPERKWARNYKYFHMILGWVLAPIALLTFGGIIG